MKILVLGLDNSILNKGSELAERVVNYGKLVEKYTVIVPMYRGDESDEKIEKYRYGYLLSNGGTYFPDEKLKLSENVDVFGVGVSDQSKSIVLIRMFFLAGYLQHKNKYDIISVQDQYYLALAGLVIARIFKTGLEIQFHGLEKFGWLRRLIVRFVLPRADSIRTVSQRMKKELVSVFNVREDRITVAPIYSELRIMDNEARVRKPIGNFIFLTVGRLVPVKNIGLQIEAMAEVVKTHPNIELWIVGDGSERTELEGINYDLKVNGIVKFFGWQNDLEKYYAQADAFLLTSNFEGWGLVVIEAANYSLPIIMTDVGCAGEVIVNEQSGLIIPSGDKNKLVSAMSRLIEDKNLRNKLGQGAKDAVNKLPSKEETMRLYKESWEKARSRIA